MASVFTPKRRVPQEIALWLYDLVASSMVRLPFSTFYSFERLYDGASGSVVECAGTGGFICLYVFSPFSAVKEYKGNCQRFASSLSVFVFRAIPDILRVGFAIVVVGAFFKTDGYVRYAVVWSTIIVCFVRNFVG